MPKTDKKPLWFGRFGKVDILLLATAVVWGGSYLAAKDLTQHASVNSMLAFRFTSAAIIMAIIAVLRGNKFSKADWQLGALYGIAVGTIMQIETNGIKLTSATNAGLIISLTIIFTPILESAWRRSWLPRKRCDGRVPIPLREGRPAVARRSTNRRTRCGGRGW